MAEQPRLSLWDAISLMVGIVVGTALFVLPGLVSSAAASPASGLTMWAVGGVLSTIGAFLYAELAVSFPRGGAYTYLSTAFGRAAGLAYGFAVLTVMLTANIGAMAFAFARYCKAFLATAGMDLKATETLGPLLAAGAVFTLAIFNARGFQSGRRTQNLLTTAKLAGLALIVVAGIFASAPIAAGLEKTGKDQPADYALAMVFVLFAFGGWSDAANVAAEVRDRARNIPKALIGGLAGVTLIYLAVNLAYLHGLGFEGLCRSERPASDVVRAAWGDTAAGAVSLLVMVSSLGAVQGMLFSGARAVAAIGEDHTLFRGLGVWNLERHTPVRAVWSLAAISLAQITLVGTEAGRTRVDAILKTLHLPPVEWTRFSDGFEVLLAGSAPTFWVLMFGVGVAFLVLRQRGATPKEFRAPGGIVSPLVYLGMCGFMLWRAILFAGALGLVGLATCAVGAGLAFVSGGGRSRNAPIEDADSAPV